MVNENLQKKIDRAIRLLQSASMNGGGNPVEVAYSGGKDSDVILQLTKEAGIAYRAIYKNTTIDPPGTVKHAREMGAEVMRPERHFFQLISDNGAPNRFYRHCCKTLKEYKVLDKLIIGVRKSESTKRAARYKEPTECKYYGSKKEENHVEAIYPILDWTDEDVVQFIEDRKLKIHPIYYREDGTIDPKRRLGCMCCPLASKKHRIEQFKKWPFMVRSYIKAQKKFFESHPDSKSTIYFKGDPFKWFYRDVFCDTNDQFEQINNGLFGEPNYKQLLEQYFKTNLSFI